MEQRNDKAKLALVTGAATGIGLAVTKALVADNWRVVATALPGQDTKDLDSLIVGKVVEVDLTNEASVEHLISAIKQEGSLNALVSNAGVAIPGPIEEVPIDQLKLQFEVNTFAPMRLVQKLLPLLRASGGRMIFVGAGQGRVALPFGGPYGASKAALAALTDSLRAEIAGSGITVSLVEPGAVRTGILASSQKRANELLANMSKEAVARYKKPLLAMLSQSERAFKNAIAPEAFAQLIVHILTTKSPKPRYLTGKEAKLLGFIAILPATLRARIVARLAR